MVIKIDFPGEIVDDYSCNIIFKIYKYNIILSGNAIKIVLIIL